MLSAQDEHLIAMLPETEYGRAFFKWLREQIEALEHNEEYGGRICNDPLLDDFRTQMGIKIGFKRALRLPEELKQKQLTGAG